MPDNRKAALEAFNRWMDSAGCLEQKHFDNGDIRTELARSAETIRAALSSPQWEDIADWHEDFGDCLFMFFREGEFYSIEFTSPLVTTFDEEYTANCDQIFFKKVDTSDFKLPPAPKGIEG